MAETKIQWSDKVWNPTRGCSRVSPGCGKQGPRWTGKVVLVVDKLAEPLHWRKPCRIFVNSMSDLFHEALSDEEIAAVFGVMAACPQHTFQVLTKRAERLPRWFAWVMRQGHNGAQSILHEALKRVMGYDPHRPAVNLTTWPLPNVHVGVSAEDQQRADERLPHLEPLARAGWLTWVSYEPALGGVNFSRWLGFLRWIVAGGESGIGARPCDLAWLRSIVEQCKAAGVPVFVKQLGAKPMINDPGTRFMVHLVDRKGGDLSEFPPDLQIRQFPTT